MAEIEQDNGIFFSWIVFDLLMLFVGFLLGVYLLLRYAFLHWARHNMPYVSASVPGGILNDVMLSKKSLSEVIRDVYDELKQNKHIVGGTYLLYQPALVIVDPEVIKHVLTKDFQYFCERGFYYNEKDEPISAHLFSLEGPKWKSLRSRITPAFSSGKLKAMFSTVVSCGDEMIANIEPTADRDEAIEVKSILVKYSTNVIGKCVFGIECNSFKDPDSKFATMGCRVFDPTYIELIKGFVMLSLPNIAKFFNFITTDREVSKFFTDIVTQTVQYRERTNDERSDFIGLLIQLKNKGYIDELGDIKKKTIDKVTLNEIIAQSFLFFVAGFETSSNTISFCLHELTMNPDCQQKLREEIFNVLKEYNGELTYEAISKMTYMDMVIDETLRKYPPLGILNRFCVQDYLIPNSNYIIQKGTPIMISTLGIQNDSQYFKNPEKFDPERFNAENRENITPYTYIPFGEGPRTCIGLRFGQIQVKIALALLLKNFKVSASPKTVNPLTLHPKKFVTAAKEDIWVSLSKI